MKKKNLTSTFCISLMLAITAHGIQKSKLKETTDSRYKVGQVWSYWARAQEKNSSFIVLKVERHPTLGNIIHIALNGLKIRKPNGAFIEVIEHLPLAETAVDSSGPKLLREKSDLPHYEEGYRLWREAFDAGRGGVYAVSIADAVEEIEANLNRGASPGVPGGGMKLLSRRRPLIFQSYRPTKNRTEVTVILGNDSELPGVVMIFPEVSGVKTPYQSGILLGAAHYDYEGTTPSGARSARFTFVTKRKDTYQEPPEFTISVEGQPIYQGEAELYLNIYEINGSKFAEQWITLKVPIDVLLRVAGAKNAEFKLGEKTYTPENFQMKYMQALANIIESQGK